MFFPLGRIMFRNMMLQHRIKRLLMVILPARLLSLRTTATQQRFIDMILINPIYFHRPLSNTIIRLHPIRSTLIRITYILISLFMGISLKFVCSFFSDIQVWLDWLHNLHLFGVF